MIVTIFLAAAAVALVVILARGLPLLISTVREWTYRLFVENPYEVPLIIRIAVAAGSVYWLYYAYEDVSTAKSWGEHLIFAIATTLFGYVVLGGMLFIYVAIRYFWYQQRIEK